MNKQTNKKPLLIHMLSVKQNGVGTSLTAQSGAESVREFGVNLWDGAVTWLLLT